jgi:hypothetical protein
VKLIGKVLAAQEEGLRRSILLNSSGIFTLTLVKRVKLIGEDLAAQEEGLTRSILLNSGVVVEADVVVRT